MGWTTILRKLGQFDPTPGYEALWCLDELTDLANRPSAPCCYYYRFNFVKDGTNRRTVVITLRLD